MQVYAPSGKQGEEQEDNAWAEEEMNGYQLLNEVGSGGTLSSLFTILSLFTENVKLSWQEDDDDEDISASASEASAPTTASGYPTRPKNRLRRSNSDVSQLALSSSESIASGSGSGFVPARVGEFGGVEVASPSPIPMGAYPATPSSDAGRSRASTVRSDATFSHQRPSLHRQQTITASQIRRGLVARATQDSTLAVIPAEAFRRLTKKFPKASAHIVQGSGWRTPEY